MDKSVIRFLRRFGEDGKPIETSYDVAIVCLNELRHIVGQPVVVAYYTQDPTTKNPMNPKTGENCRINAVTAIGIKNGIGPDCYSIISNGEIEQVHFITTTTVDDVTELVNGLVAVCYDKPDDKENRVPCYCKYDEETNSRVFIPIKGDRTFYSGYDGFLWYVSHGIIKRSDDFMSRDEIEKYIKSLLENIDLNDLKGNQDIEWTDENASGDYTKIVDIPSGNSLILSVSIISDRGRKVETEMLYYTSTGDPDMPEYSLATDRFYEYRSVPGMPGGICIKSKKESDPTTTYKFKVIYSSNPKSTTWYSDKLHASRPDLTTNPTVNLNATTGKIFKKFIRLGSEGTIVTSGDNSINIEEIAGGYDIRSNSKYEKEFKYIRESKTELNFITGIGASHWVNILNVPKNDKYIEKLPFLLYIYDNKNRIGGLVTLTLADGDNYHGAIISGDYRFNKLFINYLELGLSSKPTEYSLWFRVRDKEYSNLTFKVLSAPVGNWVYTTEGYDYNKPDVNPYNTTSSSSVKIYNLTKPSSSENIVTKESEKLITSGAVWYELDELKKLINKGLGGIGGGIEKIIIGDKTFSESTVDLTKVVEVLTNKTTIINENSTNVQYPSAEAVYLLFKGLESSITNLDERVTVLENKTNSGITSIKVPSINKTTVEIPGDDNGLADISSYVETSFNKVNVLSDDRSRDSYTYPTIELLRSCMSGGNGSITVENDFDSVNKYKYMAAIKVTSVPCKIDVSYTDISGGKCSDTLYVIDRNNSGDISLRTNTTSDVFSLIYTNDIYYICIPAKKFSENEVTCSYTFNGTSIGTFSDNSSSRFFENTVESEYVGSDSMYYGEDITYITGNSSITGFNFNQYTNILYTGSGSEVSIINGSLNSLPDKSKVFHFVNSSINTLKSVSISGQGTSYGEITDKIENVLPGSEVLFTYLESEGKIIHEVRLQKFYSSDNTITIEKTGNTWDFRNKASGGVVTLYITKDNMDEYLVPIFDKWGSADGHEEQSYEGLYGRYLINAFELRLPESWRDVNVFIDHDTYTSKFSTPNNGYIYRICPKFYNSEDKSISPSNGARVTLSGEFRLGFSIDGLTSSKTEETSNGLMHYYYGNVKNNMLETDISLLAVGNTIGVTTEALNSNNGWDGVETVEVIDKPYIGYVYDSINYFDKLPSDKRFIDFINWNGVWYCNGLYNPNVFSGKVTQAVGGIPLKRKYTNEPIVNVLEEMLCPYVQYKSLSYSNINICTNDVPTTISLKASATLGSKPLTIKIKDSSKELNTITSSDTLDVGDELTNTVTLPIKETEGNTTTITTPIPTVSTKFLVDFTDGKNSDSNKELWVNIYEPVYLFEYVSADIKSLTESYIDKLGKSCSLYNRDNPNSFIKLGTSSTSTGETTFENSMLKVTGLGKARSLCIAVPTAHLTKTKDTFAITKIVNVMSEITTAFVNTKVEVGRYTVFYEYIASPGEGYFYKAYQFKGNTKI